jgi:hypothetical protein
LTSGAVCYAQFEQNDFFNLIILNNLDGMAKLKGWPTLTWVVVGSLAKAKRQLPMFRPAADYPAMIEFGCTFPS